MGAAYTSTLLSKRGSDPALQYKVATAYGNILDLTFLPEYVTIAYQYDEVFPLDVMEKLMVLYRMAPLSLRFIVGSKSFKQPSYGGFYERWGLYPLLRPILCKMIGSGESSEFTVYGRRCCDYSDLRGIVMPPPTGSMDDVPPVSGVGPGDVVWTNVFYERTRAVLEGNIDVAKAYYAGLQTSMIELTAAMKTERARKLGGSVVDQKCVGPVILQRCKDLTCSECESAFAHVPEGTLYSDSPPWLPAQRGLFTRARLDKDKFVILYRGRKVEKGSTGRYVLQLPGGTLVDASGSTLYGLINHCCKPNCIFQKWSDAEGVEQVSLRTLRVIAANEELTADYGPDRERFACKCPACKPCKKIRPAYPGRPRSFQKQPFLHQRPGNE